MFWWDQCDDVNCKAHGTPHERLFGCGRSSKNLWMLLLQAATMAQLLVLSFCVTSIITLGYSIKYNPEIFESEQARKLLTI